MPKILPGLWKEQLYNSLLRKTQHLYGAFFKKMKLWQPLLQDFIPFLKEAPLKSPPNTPPQPLPPSL